LAKLETSATVYRFWQTFHRLWESSLNAHALAAQIPVKFEVVTNAFEAAKVPLYFLVPFAQNEHYIGRSVNNAAISNRLSKATAGNHRRLAVWGLVGVGYLSQ
jgi:hypothetical protein